jgi:hypothetical protein
MCAGGSPESWPIHQISAAVILVTSMAAEHHLSTGFTDER